MRLRVPWLPVHPNYRRLREHRRGNVPFEDAMDECVEVLKEHFKRTMVPDILHSDNGRQFRNRLVGAMAKAARFTQVHGAAETPQRQGRSRSSTGPPRDSFSYG